MLAVLTDPGLLMVLLPMAVVFAGVLTFEAAIGITIATLPRSRFQQKWTDPERRRAVRVFLAIFSVWPVGAMLVIAHVYLGPTVAIISDVIALGLVLLGLRWFARCSRERRLIMAGHCVKCFYDLRAHHHSPHCPECGTDLHLHPYRVEARQRKARNAERARKSTA